MCYYLEHRICRGARVNPLPGGARCWRRLPVCQFGSHPDGCLPRKQRGMALGLNQVAGIAGSFLGILVGGLLSQVGWRWVFLVNVPIGVAGTIWSYLSLREMGIRKRETIDWWGNLSFAAGLTMLLVGITYGINPSGYFLHELDNAIRTRHDYRRDRSPRGVRFYRRACSSAHVPAQLVPHPRFRRRQCRRVPSGGGPGRADVYARHLAAGHLVAAAWL